MSGNITDKVHLKVLMAAPGSNIHTVRHLKWLMESGCEVIFMDTVNPLPEGGERYVFVRFPRILAMSLRKKLPHLKLVERFQEKYVRYFFKQLYAKYIPDITHVHWLVDRAYYFSVARFRPLILTAWGSDINYHFLPGAEENEKALKGRILSSADLVISNTQKMDERCSMLAGKKISSIVLHFGVNTGLFHPGYEKEAEKWREQLHIPENAKVILSPRGWRQDYNHLLILEAFSSVLKKATSQAFLVFILYGKDVCNTGTYEKEVVKKAEELGILNRIRFVQKVSWEEMPVLYAASDLVVNYPTIDALPGTFVEAAACCRPVVSCKLSTYEGTFAEKYFRMVEPGDVTELAEAIEKELSVNISDRTQELNAVREYVIRNYDEKEYYRKLFEQYHRLAVK